MVHSEIEFIVQRSPYKTVAKLKDEGDHDYVLYDSERSRTQALYVPDGFPYTNLWLDIDGSTFRGTNHYTVTGAGFEFIFDILQRELALHPQSFKCSVQKGTDRVLIEASVNDFKYVSYRAGADETVISIAEKLGVSAYLILERNTMLNGYDADCSGLALQVPNQFAKKVKVEISPIHGLPVSIEVHDDKGLLERFLYKNIRIDSTLPRNLFTEDYIEDLE